eukprot:scaffold104910_cov11-Tisochrysis_lutea.AAC.1
MKPGMKRCADVLKGNWEVQDYLELLMTIWMLIQAVTACQCPTGACLLFEHDIRSRFFCIAVALQIAQLATSGGLQEATTVIIATAAL